MMPERSSPSPDGTSIPTPDETASHGTRPAGRGTTSPTQRELVVDAFSTAHDELVSAFEAMDGEARFVESHWDRPGGGGGTARILEDGRTLERAGVNMSVVHGDAVPPSLVAEHPETAGSSFFATGVSLVLHPRNPYVPAFHANFRYFETQGAAGTSLWWFGGGADLTPSYPFSEDAVHFHRSLQALCLRHAVADYPAWKSVCDVYFSIRHRHEMRGIGGIFFDRITPVGEGDFDQQLAFVRDGLDALAPAYGPIVQRRRDTSYGDQQRAWQLYRRGRYVEFNLVYDRGTLFGLQTNGNVEAILMSMPPLARWSFDLRPEPGTPESDAAAFYQPRDWVGVESERLAKTR